MGESHRSRSFVDELKRRHVVRVGVVYTAVAFAVLQAVDLAVEALALPAWTLTFMTLLALVGLPIALVLAWAFEVTPDGVKRTEDLTTGEIIAARRASWLSPAAAVLAIGALAMGASAGWFLKPDQPTATEAATAARSIAVLPFVNMSSDAEQEFFSDGMTEEILNALANVPELRVAARTSAFAYKGTSVDVRKVGQELGVASVLEGSVRKDGDDLRITAQLIEVESGFHLWTNTYDRRLENVFAIQEEIASSIAEALRVPLGLEAAAELVPHRTKNLKAYEDFLRARVLFNQRGPGLEPAIQLFESVLARDSSFAPAWAGLAETHAVLPFYIPADSAVWAVSLARAENAALRALALDSTLAEAHIALGNVYRHRRQWRAAEDSYVRGVALDPDYADGREDYAEYFSWVGDIVAAIEQAERARDLDPLTPIFLVRYCETLSLASRHDEAIEQCSRAVQLNPNMQVASSVLFQTYVRAGRYQAADFLVRDRPDAFSGRDPVALRALLRGLIDPAAGDTARAVVSSWAQPELRMLLGDGDGALRDLETDIFRMPFSPTTFLWSPAFEPLRADPRWAELVRRAGLDPEGAPK